MVRAPLIRRSAVALLTALAVGAASFLTAAPAYAYYDFTVTVTWVDAAGVQRPVPGARVRVTTQNLVDLDDRSGGWGLNYDANASGVVTTRPNSDTGAIEVRVSASAPGGAIGGVPVTTAHWGQSLSFAESEYMLAGRVQNISIVLHPTTSITGAVAAADGQPVAGAATVLLWHQATSTAAWRPVLEVPTDQAGRFAATGVPIGDYRFEVRSAPTGRLFERTFHPLSPDLAGATTFTTGVEPTTDVGTLSVGRWSLPTDRIAGSDRYATAVEVSKAVFPDPLEYSPSVLYLVSGQSFADALSASPLASMMGGVLLLTGRDALPASVEAELRRLRPENLVIVGGTGVISAAVEARVRSISTSWGALQVYRVAGVDRYDTSRKLVWQAQTVFYQGFFGRPVFLATGTDFPDALSAAAAAGSARIPLILTGGINESTLAPQTVELLDSLQPSRIYVAGGWATVSPLAMNQYAWPRLIPVARFGGADRYETSRMINAVFFGESDLAILASGTQYPDALSAGPLSVAFGAPLVLTPPECVNASLARTLAQHGTDLALLVGGAGALSARVGAMSSCSASD